MSYFLSVSESFLIEDVPQGINPKSYKIEQVVEDLTRPYLIVLDDDSVIDFSKMGGTDCLSGSRSHF